MNIINLLVFSLFFIAVKCDCTNEFDEIEEDCAKPLDLNPTNVFYFFTRGYAYVDRRKVNDFVSCTWRRWKFEDASGKIDYNKIKQDKNVVWKFSRFCDDLVFNIKMYRDAFLYAILECERNATFSTAETARLCITGNYEKYLQE